LSPSSPRDGGGGLDVITNPLKEVYTMSGKRVSKSPPDSELMNFVDVLDLLNISRRQLDRLIDLWEFPKPMRFGKRSLRWYRKEVNDWVASTQWKRYARKWMPSY
jgi:predicted DNA-binding transcriptional regulator AlpA